MACIHNQPKVYIYVVFIGLAMLKAYKSRGKADMVANRLSRFDELRVAQDWKTAGADYRKTCWDDDFSRFAADERKYYTVRAVRFDSNAV